MENTHTHTQCKSHTTRLKGAQATCWLTHRCTCMDTTRHTRSANQQHRHALTQGWDGEREWPCAMFAFVYDVSVSEVTGVKPCVKWHAVMHRVSREMCRSQVGYLCLFSTAVRLWGWGCVFHSALGMMVKGRMGLLASSSRAVRKHSVAAAVFPWACRTSPRLFHTSWAVLRTGNNLL